jgi:hypothetical protein
MLTREAVVNELVQASLQFPTVVFTIALGIALFYWVLVLLGALDIDVLGDAGAPGEGIGDAITGGAKGGAEGLKGISFDGDDGGGGPWSGLGLAAVPVTISVSIIVLVGWCGSLLAMHHAGAQLGSWFAAVLLPAVLIAALLLTALLVRPLAPVFAVKEGKSNRDYVGHTCTISTGNVDDGFGQATVEDGGTVLVIPVRCDRPGRFARGDKALIIEFDPARQVYLVEPTAEIMTAAQPGDGASESA